MNNRLSIISIVITIIVAGYLLLGWFDLLPASLVTFVSMVVFSIVGFVCAVLANRKKRNILSILALALGILAAGVMMFIFLVMLIMGMGA